MPTTRRNSRIVTAIQKNISKHALNSLSEPRREEIRRVFSKAEAEEMRNIKPNPIISHSASYRALKKRPIIKNAFGGSVTLPTTTGLSEMIGPEVYSPLFQLANLNLPRDRVTMNAWNRIFYDTHPLVRNAINLHASYPISKINITHKSKEVEDFFLELAEKLDLYSVVYGVALEFWKLGECFPYAELDKQTKTWKRITILNPDFVHVNKSAIGDQTIISLRPDEALRRIVNSKAPSDLILKRRLPQHIVKAIKRGQTIPLDNAQVSHLKLLSSPYDVRGTSVIVSIYKDLMLYDKLRESKFAQADGMVNPLTLVKLGGSNDYRPTQEDLEALRGALEEAQFDKDFKLITHDGVTIDRVGFSGAVLDIASDIELINDNIYAGLMVPKALMQQESVTYASSSIGLEVLRQRYDIFRNMIKKWLEHKIFAPIAELQGFVDYSGGENILQVPNIDFNHMNLYDMNDYIQNITNFVSNKQVSLHTLYRSLGLSYEEEQKRLNIEAIDFAKQTAKEGYMANMRLSELDSIDPEGAFPEPAEEAVPGAAPGEEEMGGLPGVPEMGGLPPLPGGGGAPPGGEAGLEGAGPPEMGGGLPEAPGGGLGEGV